MVTTNDSGSSGHVNCRTVNELWMRCLLHLKCKPVSTSSRLTSQHLVCMHVHIYIFLYIYIYMYVGFEMQAKDIWKKHLCSWTVKLDNSFSIRCTKYYTSSTSAEAAASISAWRPDFHLTVCWEIALTFLWQSLHGFKKLIWYFLMLCTGHYCWLPDFVAFKVEQNKCCFIIKHWIWNIRKQVLKV